MEVSPSGHPRSEPLEKSCRIATEGQFSEPPGALISQRCMTSRYPTLCGKNLPFVPRGRAGCRGCASHEAILWCSLWNCAHQISGRTSARVTGLLEFGKPDRKHV
jgi:hypothetical protein